MLHKLQTAVVDLIRCMRGLERVLQKNFQFVFDDISKLGKTMGFFIMM